MNLLLIRHGIAEDPDDWRQAGREEVDRPLTEKGRRKMALAAKGLALELKKIDVLAASPLARAAQTAAIIAEAFYGLSVEQIDSLAPGGSFEDMTRWLESRMPAETVALVGHEPDLSLHAARWMTGRNEEILELKKGGALMLKFKSVPRPGEGRMMWLLKPSQLGGLEM